MHYRVEYPDTISLRSDLSPKPKREKGKEENTPHAVRFAIHDEQIRGVVLSVYLSK